MRAALRERSSFVLGLGLYLVLWEVLGRTDLLGRYVPAPSEVAAFLTEGRNLRIVASAAGTTLREAALGFLLGTLAAAILATTAVLLPALAAGLDRFSAVANALPPIILGPLLLATVPREGAPVIMSAVVVLFTTYVPIVAGLRSTRPAHEDVCAALGASPLAVWWRLRVPSAVPYLLSGLKVAAPVALLGAILAEWFGAERGLGPLLVAAMQNFQINLLWAAAAACAVVSATSFAAFSLLESRVVERFR